MVFLENVAPLVNSLNLGIVSPFLLGLPPLQCAQIKTQLAPRQFNSVAPNYPRAASSLLNEAFLNVAMFNPRGSMPPRPRGPSMPDPIPRGPFHGPGAGPGGLQRQLPPNADGMPQRFMGSEMRAGFPRPNIQGPPLRMDPRQTAKRLNMEPQQQPPPPLQQQKMEGCGAHWDNPFPPGNSSQNQPPPGRMADYPPPVQSRYTNESASSILASFGLSNEDLEELSRYPDDQLTPENMPIILRDIRMRKMAPPLASLPPQSSEKENFRSDDGHGPMIKGKVIDYGHESKYGYDEGPLDVKVYGSDGPSKDSLKAFQSQPTPPASITSKQMNAVEELIRQMGFQRSAPNTQSFFSMDTSNKMSGMCLPSTGAGVAQAVQPIMPPVGPPPLPQPGIPPVRQALPPPSVARPMMPAMNQPPPPPFVPEMLGGMNRRDRIHEEARPRPSAPPGPAPPPPPAEKPFRKEIDGPIKSPFGVVKASWLPVFSKTDAQKMKRLPTPSMMNDYYAASPRIFPHMCSLCNVECRHLKDWLQHQNSSTHLESCRQLRQQYPDWNPESHSSSKRQEGERNESSGVRRRSASISPRRSRRSSSGHARRRTRSRSRSPRHRPGRPRSRSPRPPPNFRHRSRSPWRPYNPTLSFRRSSSRERGSRRYIRSPDKALEAVMKCLGPRIVEQIHKQAFSQGFSGGRRASADFEEGKTGSPAVSSKPQKREGHSRHSSSEAKPKAAEAADCPNKEEMAAEGKPKKPPSETPAKEADAPASKFWSKPRSLGTILQISDLPEDGFTDQDIKKIVQPFGKVSDILVDRCKHEAYLEMNYKEAVIAAVKFNETSPVLINGKRVKISVAEKPKAASTQTKGNEKKVTQNVKDPALNNKKEQIASVVKKITPLSPASKADAKKPGKVVKTGESKAAVKPKKTTEAKKATEARKATEAAKKPGAAAVKQNNAAEAAPSEEGKNPPKVKKTAEPAKPLDSKVKEPLKTKKLAEPKEKDAGAKGKKMGESKAKEPLKAKKVVDPKAKDLPPKAKKAPENKKAGEAPKAKKAAEPKKAGDPKDAKEPLKVKKVAESKESAKEPNAGETSQAGESQAKEASKPAEAPDKSEAVESPEAVESGVKDPEEMCVVMISSFPEAGLSLEEIRNLTKPFGKVKDILIVSSHKKAYVEISRKSADSMVKFYTCFPMWVERNQLCISLVPELKDLNEEIIFTTMIKDANPDVNTETLYTQFVHLGNLPDGGYSELEILCVGLRFGRVDHYMVITNKNKAVLQLNSAESAASMCRFLKRYPYSLGEVQLTISRSPRIEPAAADAVRKEVKNQDASQESPDLKAIPEGSGVVHPSAVPPTEATEDRGSDSKAFPETETQHLGSQKMVGEVASEPLKTEDSEEDSKALKEDFGLGAPSTSEDFESSERQSEEACALSSAVNKEEKGTDDSEQELPRKAPPSGGEKADEEVAAPSGKAGEEHAASKEETARALSASAKEEGTSADLGPGPTQAALEEMPSTDTPSADRPTSPAADRTEASVGLAETPAPRLQVKREDESEGPSAASQAKVELAAESAGVETKENLKEKFQLQLARVEVTLEKLPENLVLKAEEAKPEKTPEESAKVQNPEHVGPKTPQGKGPGQAQAEESCKAGTAEAVANPEAASLSKTVLKASNPSKTSRLSARRKEEKPAGKPVAKSQGPAEKTPSPKQPSQPRPANGRSGVPDSAKSKLSMSSVVVVALGTGKSSSQQDKDPPAEIKGSPKQSREPESRSSNLKRDAGGNKVSAGRNTRASKSSPKPKEEEELFPFNLDEFVTMDEVVDEVESPQPRRNPARGKRKDPPKKSLPCEPSSKRKKAKAAPETEVSFVTLDEIGEDEGGMGQMELLSLEAMTDAQGLVTVDEVNEEEELIDDMKDPQSLVTLDEISEQEDVAPPEMAKGPFASEESEPDLKTEPLLTVDEIGEVEELPLNELSRFKDEEMLKGKEEEKAGLEHAGDFLSSQIPDDPSILVTVDEIHEDSDDQPLMTLDEVTEEDEDFLEDFNRLKEEFTFVTVDEVGSEEEDEEEKPGPSTDGKWKEATKTAEEEEEEGAGRDAPFSAELENIKIPVDPLPEPRESAWDELLEEEASAGQPEEPQSEDPKVEEAVELDREEAELQREEKEEGQDVEQTDPAAESEPGGKQPSTEPVANQKEQPCGKRSSSQEDQQSVDRTESEGEQPETKQRKVDSAEKPKAASQLKDLDFLVPKAGYFCQICSCFCVDEESMKSHCLSQLHQQKMEKFMIKSTAEEEEEESLT